MTHNPDIETEWSLVVHGGAGRIEPANTSAEQEAGARAGLAAALAAGAKWLAEGASALDAVEAAVCVLEDDPHFNAARGAAFTHEATHELDAAIMDGQSRDAGAVAGVTRTRNPVRLARRVMEDSPHVFLAGHGADRFSLAQGLEQAEAEWFSVAARRADLDQLKSRDKDSVDIDMKYGTVGAVARDRHGHVAAATSTGGMTGKRWGRIGDSPIIGAGTYADDRAGAVSATGAGEFFIRGAAAHEICARVRLAGESLQEAAAAVIGDIGSLGGSGGVIVVGPKGEMIWQFNTAGMYRGRISSDSDPEIACYAQDTPG